MALPMLRAVAVAQRVRTDVDRQKRHDANYGTDQEQLLARMKAVLGAQRALAERQAGAVYSLRASLVDLAAVSEALAGELRDLSHRKGLP